MTTDAITLHLDSNESRLVQLALAYLVRERKHAVKYAEQIAPESRPDFLLQMDTDQHDAREISHRIDAALGIRRKVTAEQAAAAALVASLPDTPATAVEVVDCTGVIKGNADIVCERGQGGDQ